MLAHTSNSQHLENWSGKVAHNFRANLDFVKGKKKGGGWWKEKEKGRKKEKCVCMYVCETILILNGFG